MTAYTTPKTLRYGRTRVACRHRLNKRFRCVWCGAEVILFPHWSNGHSARGYGRPRGDNPHEAGTHAYFSWDCGWEDWRAVNEEAK